MDCPTWKTRDSTDYFERIRWVPLSKSRAAYPLIGRLSSPPLKTDPSPGSTSWWVKGFSVFCSPSTLGWSVRRTTVWDSSYPSPASRRKVILFSWWNAQRFKAADEFEYNIGGTTLNVAGNPLITKVIRETNNGESPILIRRVSGRRRDAVFLGFCWICLCGVIRIHRRLTGFGGSIPALLRCGVNIVN